MLWFERVVEFLVCARKDGLLNRIKNYYTYKKLEKVDIISDLQEELTLNAQMITPWNLMIRLIDAYNTLDKAFFVSRRDVVTDHFFFSQRTQKIESEAEQLCETITYYRLAFMYNSHISSPIVVTLHNGDKRLIQEIDLTENETTVTLNDAIQDDDMVKRLSGFLRMVELMFKQFLSDYWDAPLEEINKDKVKILHIRISEFSSRTRPASNEVEMTLYYYKLKNTKQVYLQDSLYTEYYFYEGYIPAQIGNVRYRLDFSIGFQVYYMNFGEIDNNTEYKVNAYVYDRMVKYMLGIKTGEGFVADYINTVALKQYFVPDSENVTI